MFFLISLLLGICYASFCEWILHKYLMHRPLGKLVYAYKAHALVHHRIFKADHSYHLQDDKDKHTIPMAWWNGPVLIILFTIPSCLLLLTDMHNKYWIPLMISIALALYYGTYEFLHWCMHLPKKRRLELWRIFRKLNGHHLLHHRYPHRNFNVVIPLADWILGTLVSRSQTRFNQARGPAVPDVQPIHS